MIESAQKSPWKDDAPQVTHSSNENDHIPA